MKAAEVDLGVDPPLTEDSLFHCPQAVEKSLKAYLTFHQRPFTKTHDLEALATSCVEQNPELEEALNQVGSLSVFAWMYRYPGSWDPPLFSEARKALTLADTVFDEIDRRIVPAAGEREG